MSKEERERCQKAVGRTDAEKKKIVAKAFPFMQKAAKVVAEANN